MKRVYLDNAASTPIHPEVVEAMLPYLTGHVGNPSSIHYHGRQLRAAIEKARKSIADLLGASPAEIVFTSGGTEADNYALRGAAMSHGIRHIITSPLEHHAVCHTAEELNKTQGVSLTWLKPDLRGNLDMGELEEALKQNPKALVSLMHGNNEIGTLNDLNAIGTLCQKYGALFHSDTVQTLGHLKLDTRTLPIDFLVASAHKFHGPKGVGFLYRREGKHLPAQITGGGQERNQRAGTENVAAIVGMAKALELIHTDYEKHAQHLRTLKEYAIAQIQSAVPEVLFNGETAAGKSLDTVLNVSFPGTDEESLLLFNLDLAGISASGGSACTSGSVKGSHVLEALGCNLTRMANSVRFSFSSFTTQEEIDYLATQLRTLVAQPA